MPAQIGIIPGDYQIPQTREACTGRLRFVKRCIGNQRTARILQQEWEVFMFYAYDLPVVRTEWRDVPEVEE